MYPSTRLSRINTPRATLWSIVLLVTALGLFGAWANFSHAGSNASNTEFANEQRPQGLEEIFHAAMAVR
ncbi:MAG: hypothetical protein HC809_12660 [Gammaproteobacteria bacterium]|nr:hypothetical protein [Gammaproteobacteria bacterium]